MALENSVTLKIVSTKNGKNTTKDINDILPQASDNALNTLAQKYVALVDSDSDTKQKITYGTIDAVS